MSTTYTPEQMREAAHANQWQVDPIDAMLRQGADWGDELHGIDAVLDRRPALGDLSSRREKVERACAVAGRANRAESALAAEQAKGQALREYLRDEIAIAIKCDEASEKTVDANWFRGKAEGYAWAAKRMDALGFAPPAGREPK